MRFQSYITKVCDNSRVMTTIFPATDVELLKTIQQPVWRTNWNSDYIQQSKALLYAQRTEDGELVGLAAYEILAELITVNILYMESEPGSGPEVVRESRTYRNIGRAFIAFGIKLSIDHGFNGDITLSAKTPELAKHYEMDYGAIRLPGRNRADVAPRYLICDETAQSIFELYLEEGLTMGRKQLLPASDAEWYFPHETDEDRLWYEIFFAMCRKFKVSWGQSTKKQKAFIEEITRVNFEREMAKRNGMPTSHIRGFFGQPTVAQSRKFGRWSAPPYRVLPALQSEAYRGTIGVFRNDVQSADTARSDSMALPSKKPWHTFADVLAWDESERVEIIDGEVIMMAPAPARVHQEISFELCRQLGNYLKGKRCKAYPAPFDVRLFEEDGDRPENVDTVVEPDITIVCDPSKLDERGCKGAPDMVVEILSPSTQRHDRFIKFSLYQRAGVREYWIVDPDSKTIQSFILEDGHYAVKEFGTPGDTMKVNVLEDCIINLSEVFPE